MTLTVRLKAKHQRLLREATRRLNRSQSDFVREAIVHYAADCLRQSEGSAAERLKRWLGVLDSGGKNLSVRSGEKFRALLGRKGHGRGSH